ncbi:MAG TPA: hypothetical protein VHQ47_15100 [Phycisphaerae bacterium]|jgi:hypothetical protein|nr:hypothetical protein [Phycisphaerae bacterium]
MRTKKQPRLPEGWTFDEIEQLRKHYDQQTEEEAAAEDEAAYRKQDETLMSIPKSLVPQVKKLLNAHSRKGKGKPQKQRRVA